MRYSTKIIKTIVLGHLSIVICSAASAELSEPDNIPDQFTKECEHHFPPTSIEVTFVDATITENHLKSFKEITTSARALKSTHADESYVLGQTKFESTWRLSAEFASLQIEGKDLHCIRPKIKIELGFNYHQIEIAKELEYQSCEYNFVRNHEYQHVYINKNNMETYRRELAEAVNYRFSSSILYGAYDTVKNQLETMKDSDWLPFVKDTIAKLEAEGANRHKLLDTPEEYAKGNTVCDGKIPAVMRKYLDTN